MNFNFYFVFYINRCRVNFPTPSKTVSPTYENCTDFPGWKDIFNYDCGWYEKKYNRSCTDYDDYYETIAGSIGESYFGYTAFDACCKLDQHS